MSASRRPRRGVPGPSARQHPTLRRRLSRAGKAQVAFTLLAMLIICSMVLGFVGPAVVDAILQGESPQEQEAPSRDELEASLRQQVAENPDDAGAMANLANYLSNTGQAEESITWYEQSLALQPDEPAVRLDFAQSLASSAKPRDAELQFQKVIEAEPRNPQAHFYLAELYQSWDPPRTEEAIAEYRLVIEVGPDTYVAELASEQLGAMGVATPAASATPATPTGGPDS